MRKNVWEVIKEALPDKYDWIVKSLDTEYFDNLNFEKEEMLERMKANQDVFCQYEECRGEFLRMINTEQDLLSADQPTTEEKNDN